MGRGAAYAIPPWAHHLVALANKCADSRAALFVAVCALFVAGACRNVERNRDWTAYDGPGAHWFQKEEIPFPSVEDPLEPTNRVLAGVDLAFARYLFAPIGAIYRWAVPQYVRTCLTRACDNVLYPTRVVNNLLQGKLAGAKDETARFAVNTTVGVLGLYDPAAKLGLHPSPEDFGQTFAKWGWKESTYLYLPVLGSSTVRDAFGEIPNVYTDPTTYYLPASIGRRFHKTAETVEEGLRQVDVNFDAYEPARMLHTLQRTVDVENFSWKRDESSPTQSLDAVFLAPEDPAFVAHSTTDEIFVPGSGKRLAFTYWLQLEPAPLVYVVPGLGGHRLSDSALALAEIAFKNGNSVVTLSNPTNYEFIANGASTPLPGYAPTDAHDLHVVLTRADEWLDAHYPGRFTSRRLAGISMGALYTLFVAAAEKSARAEGLRIFDVYLALDPAVSLEHGLLQLDRFYNAPLEFAPEERARKIEEIFGKVLYLSHGELQPGSELPFTRLESEFLIGLAFRLDLQFMIFQSQEREDQGVLLTKRSLLSRAPAFREASRYSYMEYVYAFLLPYLARRSSEFTFDEAGARAVFERCDLRSIDNELRANDRVLVFANENDFLLRPEDIEWLRATLGERAQFFPAGGHLGNLHRKTIQEVIGRAVERTDDAEAPQQR